jgi:hypothetical protein
MKRNNRLLWVLLGLSGCGGSNDDNPAMKTCSLTAPAASCTNGQVCEDAAGHPTCVAPVVVRGKVLAVDGSPVVGAVVAALDANDAPATGTAMTAADGSYELGVAVARTVQGLPIAMKIKLRASAAGFSTFPSGLRRSLPLELSAAMAADGKLVFRNSATDLVLDAIAAAGELGSITGAVQGDPGKRGVLVVAEGPAVLTGVSAADGAYVLFNAPPGAYTVRGYASGVQLNPALATVAASARTTSVDLSPRAVPLGTVAGSVSIVDAPGASMTSVVLVVASTFNEALKRGEVPPGLRAPKADAPSISGAFTITDVPDGEYVVLAAFENDGLVRDPDTAIGGTQIQRAIIGDGGRQAVLGAGFKLTGALTVLQPGAGEAPDMMANNPTFSWKDDSSEDRYVVEVIDGRGTIVWTHELAKVTGGDVNVVYAGPPLARGTLYQFRATSYRKNNIPISQTEDLRGVFFMQ